MVRISKSPDGFQRLRLWRDGDWPIATTPPGQFAVEWVGRAGHPTSYALLGGRLVAEPAVAVDDGGGGRFGDSLAGRSDVVHFGLADEYRDCVLDSLVEAGAPVRVTVAAHGELGSSVVAFRAAALFLISMLGHSDIDEDSLWLTWKQAFTKSARR